MINRSPILNELRRRGSATVAELAEALQLDSHTVVSVLKHAEGNQKDHVRKQRKVPRHDDPRQSVWTWEYIEAVPFGVKLTVDTWAASFLVYAMD